MVENIIEISDKYNFNLYDNNVAAEVFDDIKRNNIISEIFNDKVCSIQTYLVPNK